MAIKVNAAARLKVTAAKSTNVVADLKKVGFKNLYAEGRGYYSMDEMPEAKVKQACDKLLKMGYKKQGNDLYPSQGEDDKGWFYLIKDDIEIGIDPEGYIYLN